MCVYKLVACVARQKRYMVYSGIYFRSTVIVIQYSVQVVRGTYMYVVREVVSVSSVSCAISKSQDVQLSNYRVEGSSSRGTTCIQVQRYKPFLFLLSKSHNSTTNQKRPNDNLFPCASIDCFDLFPTCIESSLLHCTCQGDATHSMWWSLLSVLSFYLFRNNPWIL